ncbi:bifunctional glycosyltransferase/CDP-glycerol:glycerophosphate glycerophosphotransferase [Solidesulfovibrio magneticus]|nr:CDP-glycerol glycerophosphotransferase family protein [Solidesulfovibrio magneticus]
MTAVTVVVPVYNAEMWIPRFIDCMQRQVFKDFEVLMIDDGSTDNSVALMLNIASIDSRFKIIQLPDNRGCGEARNIGIASAKGETLCFADPDDFLPENSLEVRYAAYKKHRAVVRACHHEVMDDGTIRNMETRPSALPEICSPVEVASRVGVNPFLCAHWTWLWPTSLLRKNGILNGENMRTGEDIYLLARVFFLINRVVWIDDVVYYWIKRTDSLSTTMYTPEHYGNYFAICDIFYKEATKRDQVALADMFFNEYLLTYPGHLLMQISQGKSTEQDAREVIRQMAQVAHDHGVFARCLEVIKKNPLRYPGIHRLHHILTSNAPSAIQRLADSQASLAPLMREVQYRAIRAQGWSQELVIDKFDTESELLRVRYMFCDNRPTEVILWGDDERTPAYAKNRTVHVDNHFTIFERILWLALPSEAGAQLRLLIAGQETSLHHTGPEIRAAFAPRPLDDTHFPPDVRALRRLVTSPVIQRKFKDAWLFIDRDTEADDNAEHLYRWVRREHPEVNAWFVLNQDSHDWERLEQEGFRLIAHGSVEHGALFLLSRKLISSQRDRYIFAPLEEQYFRDFPKPQFICLAHGVIKDDMSPWLNTVPCDIFISSTHDEARSISGDGSPYLITAKEQRVTGLARHDRLLQPCKKENILFVMPTWRADLVGKWDGKGQRRERNPNFLSSSYIATWKDVLEDPRLKSLLERYGYQVVFFSHPGFSDYLEEMPFPSFVQKLSKSHGSVGETLRISKIMITDFSSVAFDMAYMHKPVIYYQHEEKAAYIKSQAWASGYFNYHEMGFGPVCHDKQTLFAHLEEALKADGQMQPPYLQRAEKTFAYHDAGCCQRIFEAITVKVPPQGRPDAAMSL